MTEGVSSHAIYHPPMSRPIRIVHIVPSLHPHYGGPARTVARLVDALAADSRLRVALVTQSRHGEPSIASAHAGVARHVAASRSRLESALGLPVRRALSKIFTTDGADLVHVHGLWSPALHWGAAASRRHRVPLVIHVRGMLEPWALAHKARKKRVGLALYQRTDLAHAALLVATSEAEVASLRDFGLKQAIAMIPNGVELPPDSRALGDRPESPERTRTVLFMSRIHPVKGLENLVEAWAQVRRAGWRLRIAGPDTDAHLAVVLARVNRLGLGDSVQYAGEITEDDKAAAFAAADLFVLPTFSENFGVVVVEALAHGLPVITTRAAPWDAIEPAGCGWWIDIGVAPLARALLSAMSLSDAQRREMGNQGRLLARRYAWGPIATEFAGVYRWLLGEGDRPACVEGASAVAGRN